LGYVSGNIEQKDNDHQEISEQNEPDQGSLGNHQALMQMAFFCPILAAQGFQLVEE
jgi:hypothetical protein